MPNFINTSIVASGKDYRKKRKVKEISNWYMGGTGHFFFYVSAIAIVQLHCSLK